MSVVTTAVSSLTELVKMVKGIQRQAAKSLSQYTKDANIIGRVYMEEKVARDEIAVPLMGVLNQLYVSYILTALNLDRMISSGKTVRESIGVVASEGYPQVANLIESAFGKENLDKPLASFENQLARIEDESQRLVCGRLIELDMMGAYTVETTDIKEGGREDTAKSKDDSETSKYDKNDILNETSKTTGNKSGTSTSKSWERTKKETGGLQAFKAYLYVQLIPYLLDTATATKFFEFNFVPGFLRRWRQLRAGEIKFFRDFIFAKDLVEKQKSSIKQDKSGTLVSMMMRQRSSLFKWVSQLIGISPENHNAASSMYVISKQSFDAACAASNVKFSSASDRARFFSKTFTLLVVVVDNMYGTVELYIHGLNTVGKYTFDMVNKVGTKGRDSFDLKQIMQAFNQGMTPKF